MRCSSGKRLVQHDPETVDIGCRTDRLSLELLRCHVPERADARCEHAGLGCRLGNAEVGEHGVVVMAEENIGWLDVTVNHARSVSEVESVGDLTDPADGSDRLDRPASQLFGYRRP